MNPFSQNPNRTHQRGQVVILMAAAMVVLLLFAGTSHRCSLRLCCQGASEQGGRRRLPDGHEEFGAGTSHGWATGAKFLHRELRIIRGRSPSGVERCFQQQRQRPDSDHDHRHGHHEDDIHGNFSGGTDVDGWQRRPGPAGKAGDVAGIGPFRFDDGQQGDTALKSAVPAFIIISVVPAMKLQ